MLLTPRQKEEVASHLDDSLDLSEGSFPNDEKTQKYGNLLFLLQSEPRHIAHLCRLVTMAEIDQLLQTVMFTIYGNQYESREEHLLLTMFQVSILGQRDKTKLIMVAVCIDLPIRGIVEENRRLTCFRRIVHGKATWRRLYCCWAFVHKYINV